MILSTLTEMVGLCHRCFNSGNSIHVIRGEPVCGDCLKMEDVA